MKISFFSQKLLKVAGINSSFFLLTSLLNPCQSLTINVGNDLQAQQKIDMIGVYVYPSGSSPTIDILSASSPGGGTTSFSVDLTQVSQTMFNQLTSFPFYVSVYAYVAPNPNNPVYPGPTASSCPTIITIQAPSNPSAPNALTKFNSYVSGLNNQTLYIHKNNTCNTTK